MNKENVITLDNPVKRGEQVIEQVTLMKPMPGRCAVSVWRGRKLRSRCTD
ncbi:putative gpE+E' [Escherichia coli 2770900]|nr:putative gpE+E' [Escherichia coli 2770900]